MVHAWEVAPGPGTLFVIREPMCRFSGSISTTRLGSNEDRPLGFREQMTGVDEERIHAAMQIIGEGIGMETFCSALNVTDGDARRLLHEMGHRRLAGFAGGLVTPSIDVIRNRRMAHRPEPESGSGSASPVSPEPDHGSGSATPVLPAPAQAS
jgi:hypothetical protein